MTRKDTPEAGPLVGTFPERLAQLRTGAGWSQSELARKIWGTTTDSRGYEVARNRDRISAYESGRAKPSSENLAAIAAIFNLDVEELAPELAANAAFAEPTPAFEMRLVEGGAFIRINTKVPADVALQIAEILQKAGVR